MEYTQPSLEQAGLDPHQAVDMLKQMWSIRLFEEKAEALYAQGKIHGTMHLSIGMEASAVGAVYGLREDDLILSTHRGHGHCIAKGADLPRMMAEFMGKEAGYCRGRGGSMHIADVEGGNLGANGVVAGGIPLAVGVGLGLKMQKRDQIVLCFFGDGAVNSGPFNEAANMAAIYRLPVVFVCENNQYAMSFPVRKAFAIEHLSQRGGAYGMPAVTVDGNDVLAVFLAVKSGIDLARSGGGPSFIENVTYRWRGHSKSDANRYRSREEIEAWREKCPIQRFERLLLEQGVLDETALALIRQEACQRIEEAAEFGEACPEPSLETIEDGVYAG
jgi:acetoin:2,6-dichlorophenolindophenol oxidoreductase subunit alpha